jgi:hypothetical protein
MITIRQKASQPDLTDDQFLESFEAGTISNHDFKHADHMRMAWIYLTRLSPERAKHQIIAGIRNFAAIHGATQLYHETITLFWIHAVEMAIRKSPARQFDEFIQENRHLLDKGYIYRFYTKDLLMSSEAKISWMDPDLMLFGTEVRDEP